MIARTTSQPISSYRGAAGRLVAIGALALFCAFDVWEGNNSAAGYYVYTFIPHGTAGQGNLPTGGSLNVDMKTFFNWLQANRSNAGHYNNSMYLDVVEAGLEITRGNGWAYVTANISAR